LQDSKSFQTKEKFRNSGIFGSQNDLSNKPYEEAIIQPTIADILEKLQAIILKLLVSLKYLFVTFAMPQLRKVKLSWVQLCLLSLLGYIAIKKDFTMSFNIDEGGTSHAMIDNQEARSNSTAGFAQNAAIKNAPPANPFEAKPGDSPKVKKDKAYIRRFTKIAKAEQDKYGIPASVKMAQALLESGSGTSRLAKNNNNHFGMKCFSKKCVKGHCSNFNDDHHKDFFRKYGNAWESWRAHSQLISNGRYKKLITEDNNYKDWAYGLKKLGYATDARYAEKLINTIEKYQLNLLD